MEAQAKTKTKRMLLSALYNDVQMDQLTARNTAVLNPICCHYQDILWQNITINLLNRSNIFQGFI